ncbi:MAG TPA: alpha/beta hydrolase [Desulfobacterales bacterium]
MGQELLDCVEIDPDGETSAVVIWLHGLGADGHDFEAIVPELRLPDEMPVRFVFPHAPRRPVTINFSMVMRAWYDIVEMDVARKIDFENFLESAERLKDLIARERQSGIPSERILLAGFSQGGAVALHTGLRYEEPLAGIMALSTYLPTVEQLAKERNLANAAVPVFMAHGRYDSMIPIDNATVARETMESLGYPVEWHAYPIEHQVSMEEIRDIRNWLLTVLG